MCLRTSARRQCDHDAWHVRRRSERMSVEQVDSSQSQVAVNVDRRHPTVADWSGLSVVAQGARRCDRSADGRSRTGNRRSSGSGRRPRHDAGDSATGTLNDDRAAAADSRSLRCVRVEGSVGPASGRVEGVGMRSPSGRIGVRTRSSRGLPVPRTPQAAGCAELLWSRPDRSPVLLIARLVEGLGGGQHRILGGDARADCGTPSV